MATPTELAELFVEIEKNETNYAVREPLVYQALATAKRLGYKAGIRVDAKDLAGPVDANERAWPIVCIVLPDAIGEVSWHCPAYDVPYTNYDTVEKYRRAQQYVKRHGH